MYEVETYDLRLYLALYKENKKVSNRTLDNIRKTISSFFSWMHDEGHIGRNPARALKQIKYTKEVKKHFIQQSGVSQRIQERVCNNAYLHRYVLLCTFLITKKKGEKHMEIRARP